MKNCYNEGVVRRISVIVKTLPLPRKRKKRLLKGTICLKRVLQFKFRIIDNVLV